jgi:hypothetical protein
MARDDISLTSFAVMPVIAIQKEHHLASSVQSDDTFKPRAAGNCGRLPQPIDQCLGAFTGCQQTLFCAISDQK